MKEIVTAKEFNALATQDKPVLLDFYADWCGPCQVLLPTVERLAKKYEGKVHIQKVNVDRFPKLAQKFNVRSIPTLILMEDQKVLEKLMGNQSQSQLEAFINRNVAVEA